MDCVICRYGELALKGKNRHLFENRLVDNINDCLEKNSITADVQKVRGRIFVFTDDNASLTCLKNVFGLVSLSSAVVIDNVPQAIQEKVIDYVKKIKESETINTFRITTKRPNKEFPKKSNEMDILLGDAVNEEFGFKVKLKNPDLNIGVEIHDKTFIFHEKIPGFGGLPLGITGKVVCLIEKEKDLAAAWLMMKRGCAAFPVSIQDIDKCVDTDISLLKKFSYGSEIKLNKIKELIDINSFAEENKCKAVVIGDTLEEFDPERYNDMKQLILTPLIAYNEKNLSDLLVRIR
jgi:thiamine biosynthesis protein ThiI